MAKHTYTWTGDVIGPILATLFLNWHICNYQSGHPHPSESDRVRLAWVKLKTQTLSLLNTLSMSIHSNQSSADSPPFPSQVKPDHSPIQAKRHLLYTAESYRLSSEQRGGFAQSLCSCLTHDIPGWASGQPWLGLRITLAGPQDSPGWASGPPWLGLRTAGVGTTANTSTLSSLQFLY